MLIELHQPNTGHSILIADIGTLVSIDSDAYARAWERITVYNQLVFKAKHKLGEILEIRIDGTIMPQDVVDSEGLQFWYETKFTEINN